MREGVEVRLRPGDRERLEGVVGNRKSPQHHVWRARIVIDKQTPAALDLHLILDNYAAHKTEAVKRWLARHPRVHVHFTPTSASWINAVEGVFATDSQ